MNTKEKKRLEEHERWWKLMNVPLENVSQEDLEWAERQDQFNSYCSKRIWQAEIERRKGL